MGRTLCLASTLLMVCVLQSAATTTWHVDGSVSGSGDGKSWETAFQKVQEGINAASHADTVIVRPGTYVENIHFDGKNITLTSTDPLDPTVVESTVIDGDQAGSVVTFSGEEDESCVLSGFTITNGSEQTGGGIRGGKHDKHTHASIRNNAITDNRANYAGGGLAYCDGLIEHNDINANLAEGLSAGGGGLAYCDGTILSNSISGNIARNVDPDRASGVGGGLCDCNGRILSNTVVGNWSDASGGGFAYCGGVIQNNLMSGNSAGRNGGGLYNCVAIIQNCTITANSARLGAGLCGHRGIIRNCIIWGNSASEGRQIDSSTAPTYSCVQGGGAPTNIFEDPLFVDSAAGDYHLQPASPCIDAGVNYYWFVWPQWDLDGNSRLAGERVDIGCYEYGAFPDSDGDLISDPDESSAGSDPEQEDTDRDGLRDGLELLRGSDPLTATPSGTVHVPSEIHTIQKALCLALDGDEILVSPGTYRGNLRFCGSEVTLRSARPNNLETVASTVIEGGGAGPAVAFMGSEGRACVLSGLTIRGVSGCWGAGIHGGILSCRTHATIQNNVITGTLGGATVFLCDGIIENNTVSENGGPGLASCNGTIQNNTISKNNGGGLVNCNGLIRNNIITRNWTSQDGGGLYHCDGIIQYNIITYNCAKGELSSGGGLADCDGTIQNNTISGNSAPGGGGLSRCPGIIRNNKITGNSASVGGGLFLCWMPGSHGVVLNNTICGNSAKYVGGGVYDLTTPIRNCIIWGNTAPEGAQLFECDSPTYSCIQGWTGGGEGNIAEVPRFADAENGDFRLSPSSPCIDAGDNSAADLPDTDIVGMHRIMFGGKSLTVDMGAYEYYINEIELDAESNITMTWSSLAGKTYAVYFSSDTMDWQLAADTVPSAGDTVTTWLDPTAPLLSSELQRRYYRIKENE
ncbi:right-handed parallel beta-helix repeat-containing protein [bacterium]|nr:right-handed parallel beta-helix repeat-containing protein [bacterium]